MAQTKTKLQTDTVFTVQRSSVRDTVAGADDFTRLYGTGVTKLNEITPLTKGETTKAIIIFGIPIVFFIIAIFLTAFYNS